MQNPRMGLPLVSAPDPTDGLMYHVGDVIHPLLRKGSGAETTAFGRVVGSQTGKITIIKPVGYSRVLA